MCEHNHEHGQDHECTCHKDYKLDTLIHMVGVFTDIR